MKWQGSSWDYTSSIPASVKSTVNVALDSKPWNGWKQSRVVRVLSLKTPDTLTVAAGEKSSLTIIAALREC